MPTTSVLERRRASLTEDLQGILTEAEDRMGRDDFDPEDDGYVALRENRERVEGQLTDIDATLRARQLINTTPPPQLDTDGQEISPMRRILREYDRGHSERFDVEYEIRRELQTGDPYFTPRPTRIDVQQLPVITPTLDSLRAVPVGSNNYDFVVPTRPVPALTVPEGGKKPTRTWAGTPVKIGRASCRERV